MALRRATSDIGERIARVSADKEVAAAVADYASDARLLRLAVTVTLVVAGLYTTMQVRRKPDAQSVSTYTFLTKLWMGESSSGIVPFLVKLWLWTLVLMAALPVMHKVARAFQSS